MKKGNIRKWANIEDCQNLLFFAQLCDELLFDYSSPSNRISTLNSHYLCFDAISAINDIELRGVPDGTIKPIIAELFDTLEKDTAFVLSNENPNKYFIKHNADRFHVVKDTKELNYNDAKKAVHSINKKYFSENKYFKLLKSHITTIIKENDTTNQMNLFRLTKSLLTELVNNGYSLLYIYYHLNHTFFRTNEIYTNEQIDIFFNGFSFVKSEFNVVFVTENTYDELIGYTNIFTHSNELKINDVLPKRIVKKDDEERYLITDSIPAYDPYSAVEKAKHTINVIGGFYKLNDHNYKWNLDNMKCALSQGW